MSLLLHFHFFICFSVFSTTELEFFYVSMVLLLFFLFILSVTHYLKQNFKWCDCEICHTYLTCGWIKRFVNLCDWYSHLIKQSPTKTIHIHVLGNTITANPENVEYILKTRFDNFPKGKPFSDILGDFLGKGIFNVDGDTWRFQRKLASLELDRRSIRVFASNIIETEIEKRLVPLLIKNRNDNVVLDLQEVFRRFSFDTICRFSFGLDPMCLDTSSSEFAAAFDLASRLSAERTMTSSPAVWRLKRLLNIGSEKRLKRAIKAIHSLAQQVITEKRKLGFENSHKDLLSRFMRTVQNDDALLRDIVISFLLAGRDTIASALTSFFWLMAQNPEAESKIRAEADRVLGPGFLGLKSFDELKELRYLQAAIFESMRLFPPIQFDSKFCLNDDVLPDGTFVKSGTRVTYHAYAMGRAEEIWGPDCAEFRPERWLRGNGEDFGASGPTENAFKYPVFQAGVRVCLGKEMALVELKNVALALVRRFRFQLVSAGPPRFSPGLTATFSGGLPVLVREIEKK